ncbi:MAG: GNAT family N-acetyltransferase, partial [Gemmatimonadales bacterium]
TAIRAVSDERSIEAVRALIREHFEAHSEAHDPEQIDEIIGKLPDPYAPPSGGLWVAWRGGDAVGCVALQSQSAEAGEVKRMYVRPAHRGEGIARQLAHLVIDEARMRGYAKLRLGTLATMQPAQNLYTSLGFLQIDPYRPIEFGHTLFYELDLGIA